MARGFAWAYYHSDDGNVYAVKVEADYAAMAERGWEYPASAGTFVYPRGWSERKVVGPDETGRVRKAIVASTTADLWTGVASTFAIIGNDGLTHTCTVLRRYNEVWSQRPR